MKMEPMKGEEKPRNTDTNLSIASILKGEAYSFFIISHPDNDRRPMMSHVTYGVFINLIKNNYKPSPRKGEPALCFTKWGSNA